MRYACPHCGFEKDMMGWLCMDEIANYLDMDGTNTMSEIHVIECPECKGTFRFTKLFTLIEKGIKISKEGQRMNAEKAYLWLCDRLEDDPETLSYVEYIYSRVGDKYCYDDERAVCLDCGWDGLSKDLCENSDDEYLYTCPMCGSRRYDIYNVKGDDEDGKE